MRVTAANEHDVNGAMEVVDGIPALGRGRRGRPRLKIRWERRVEIYLAFLLIGCIPICWRILVR